MTVKQISVFLENKPGQLAKVVSDISKSDINLRAMSLAEAEDFGIVRLIAADAYSAEMALKDAGYVCSVKDVIAVEIEDKPGSLSKVLDIIGENGINMEYMYAFTTPSSGADMIMKVADVKAAAKVLAASGVKMISQDDLA